MPLSKAAEAVVKPESVTLFFPKGRSSPVGPLEKAFTQRLVVTIIFQSVTSLHPLLLIVSRWQVCHRARLALKAAQCQDRWIH